jgi:hypothetical protein
MPIPLPVPVASSAPTAVARAPAAEAAAPPEEAPIQHRIFDPPPPNIAPPTSPSIRPPMGRAAPPPRAPAARPVVADTKPRAAPPVAAPEPGDDHAPAAPPAPRVFAPQTYAQGRKPWTPPRPGAFARLPAWAIITAAAGLCLAVVLVVIFARSLGKTPPRAGPETPATRAAVPDTQSISRVPAPVPSPAESGRVYDGGTVPRSSDLYYIIIYTTPSQTVAQSSADLLAKNGVDVSIERVSMPSDVRNPLWYMLVSVEGYRSNTAAQPALKRIQQIGNLQSPNAWKDARASNGLTSPGAPASRAGATSSARGGTAARGAAPARAGSR